MITNTPKLHSVAISVSDTEGLAALDRARFRRLLKDEKARIIAAELAAWTDTDLMMTRNKIRALVWDRCKGKCSYCGKIMNPFLEFSIDHVHPRSRGGADGLHNYVGCCRSCNSQKGARTK